MDYPSPSKHKDMELVSLGYLSSLMCLNCWQLEPNNDLRPQYENPAPALLDVILLCPWCPGWTINNLHCEPKGHAILRFLILDFKRETFPTF